VLIVEYFKNLMIMKQRQGTILTGKRSKINIRWEIDCADSPTTW